MNGNSRTAPAVPTLLVVAAETMRLFKLAGCLAKGCDGQAVTKMLVGLHVPPLGSPPCSLSPFLIHITSKKDHTCGWLHSTETLRTKRASAAVLAQQLPPALQGWGSRLPLLARLRRRGCRWADGRSRDDGGCHQLRVGAPGSCRRHHLH